LTKPLSGPGDAHAPDAGLESRSRKDASPWMGFMTVGDERLLGHIPVPFLLHNGWAYFLLCINAHSSRGKILSSDMCTFRGRILSRTECTWITREFLIPELVRFASRMNTCFPPLTDAHFQYPHTRVQIMCVSKTGILPAQHPGAPPRAQMHPYHTRPPPACPCPRTRGSSLARPQAACPHTGIQ